jgi:chromate transporter
VLTSSDYLSEDLAVNSDSLHQDDPSHGAISSKVSLLRLAWYFFVIALTTVQGAAGHLRRQIVIQRKLVTEKEFLESFALAEFLPQPDSTFGLAVHIGQRVRGVPGALVVAIAMIMPSFLLALLLGSAFIHFHKVSWVIAVAAGAGAAVCSVIGATLLEIGRKAVIDYRDFLLILLVFVLLRYGILHISGVLIWVTPLALWLHRPSRHEKLHGMQEPPGLIPTLGFRHFLRRKLDQIFNSERWGMALTAVAVVAMMGLISSIEKSGPGVVEKIQGALTHDHKPQKEQACPAIPFKPLSPGSPETFPIAPICTDLVSTFSALSVCAFGGEETILPCMQRASVSHHNWMDKGDFLNFFSLSFIIPGPSMLAAFIGLKACSPFGEQWALVGALIAMLALFVPNMAVILTAAHSWDWLSQWRWRPSLGKALLLIASGALSAAFMFITESAVHATASALIAIGAALILLLTDLNPVLIILLSGVAGLLFLG